MSHSKSARIYFLCPGIMLVDTGWHSLIPLPLYLGGRWRAPGQRGNHLEPLISPGHSASIPKGHHFLWMAVRSGMHTVKLISSHFSKLFPRKLVSGDPLFPRTMSSSHTRHKLSKKILGCGFPVSVILLFPTFTTLSRPVAALFSSVSLNSLSLWYSVVLWKYLC